MECGLRKYDVPSLEKCSFRVFLVVKPTASSLDGASPTVNTLKSQQAQGDSTLTLVFGLTSLEGLEIVIGWWTLTLCLLHGIHAGIEVDKKEKKVRLGNLVWSALIPTRESSHSFALAIYETCLHVSASCHGQVGCPLPAFCNLEGNTIERDQSFTTSATPSACTSESFPCLRARPA